MNRLSLYNHFHNGDVFYSRVLINVLSQNFDIDYYHNLKTPLLSDIRNLREIKGIPDNFEQNSTNLNEGIVNAWIGQNKCIYLKAFNQGCSFENYFELVKTISSFFNIKLEKNESEYLPEVNYNLILNNLNIRKIADSLKNTYKKLVLISNGPVQSGQSNNVEFDDVIYEIANENKNILFFITKPILYKCQNILDVSLITNTVPDLLQISLLSTYCDVIVGRASGPYCYAHTKENLLNENKVFVSFSFNRFEGYWYNSSRSKQIWSPNFSKENIKDSIIQAIKY